MKLTAELLRQVVVVAHRSSSPLIAVCREASCLKVASALLAWDFTVPTEMPSTSAVSASLSSS